VPVAKFEFGAFTAWSGDFVNQDTLSAFVAKQLAAHSSLAAGGGVCAVIPARYASVRFPGKMMADLMGKSMIQRTFERVRASPAVARVFLTTESEGLAAHCRVFAGNSSVVMSSDRPRNGM
jgi:CTP:molybdopterin cytidylyltransferase MocA